MATATRQALVMWLLAVASSSAMAEWVEIGNSNTDTLYADPAIRVEGQMARLWALNDFKTAQPRGEGTAFMSQKMQYEYDCKTSRYRLLYFSAHSGTMAEGEVVDFNIVPGDWEPITPGSGLEATWKFACRKA